MEGSCTSDRKAKHMDVLAGIDRLRAAKNKLQALFDEIVGAVEKKTPSSNKEVAEEYPTLAKVLNQAGNNIAEEADNIIDLTNEIRNQIF